MCVPGAGSLPRVLCLKSPPSPEVVFGVSLGTKDPLAAPGRLRASSMERQCRLPEGCEERPQPLVPEFRVVRHPREEGVLHEERFLSKQRYHRQFRESVKLRTEKSLDSFSFLLGSG